jgi:putative endonuclease
MSSCWYVYILECQDDTLYTGITTNLNRRLKEHKAGKGSSYTASRGVKDIVYTEKADDRSQATQREVAIKQLSRKEKEGLVHTDTES